MTIEVIVRSEVDESSIGKTETSFVPRVNEILWILPRGHECEKKYGTRSFLVEEVCYHFSMTLKNYDSAVLYVTPIIA